MQQRRIIVGLGEVLWDVFPDGPRFGGAPANFACSIAELAGDRVESAMASSVGTDELGARALEELRGHGVDTRCVTQIDRPTGRVDVTLDASGSASYDFAADTAWDNLTWSHELESLAARADAVCFGTLGQRCAASRKVIRRFLGATRPDCLRVFDINLRPPFWSEEVVLHSLELAGLLKLNDAELPVLAGMLGLHGGEREQLDQLLGRYPLELIALTRGAKGSLLLSRTGECSELPGNPAKVVDTVGAGDAFTAALVLGRLGQQPLAAINDWANRVAAFVCSQPGATPHFTGSLRCD
jgi:fructokinase